MVIVNMKNNDEYCNICNCPLLKGEIRSMAGTPSLHHGVQTNIRDVSQAQPDHDLLVQTDSEGSLSARWKPLWQGQMLAPRALL